MAKPLGIVAMLTLLATSGTALASDSDLLTRQIDLWGVTNTGALYLETKQGERYSVPIKHCPAVRSNKEYTFTPVELVHTFEDANVWFRGRRVLDDARITFHDRNSREQISCVLGTPINLS